MDQLTRMQPRGVPPLARTPTNEEFMWHQMRQSLLVEQRLLLEELGKWYRAQRELYTQLQLVYAEQFEHLREQKLHPKDRRHSRELRSQLIEIQLHIRQLHAQLAKVELAYFFDA